MLGAIILVKLSIGAINKAYNISSAMGSQVHSVQQFKRVTNQYWSLYLVCTAACIKDENYQVRFSQNPLIINYPKTSKDDIQ